MPFQELPGDGPRVCWGRRRRAPQQIDLFAREPHNAIGNMPAWSMTADGHTSGADELDNTIDPGARRRDVSGHGLFRKKLEELFQKYEANVESYTNSFMQSSRRATAILRPRSSICSQRSS
jgi:hypothetical protein